MSRIGNSPIKLPDGVNITAEGSRLVAKGSKGELEMALPDNVNVYVGEGLVKVVPLEKSIHGRSIWGTVRANINNMVVGVSKGFARNLEINGVGYRAAMQGNKLQLSLGLSHPVEMNIPAGLSVKVENNTKIEITGTDKQLLGQFASEIRAKRPPEPFKGKGIKYAEEHIVRKEGKKK